MSSHTPGPWRYDTDPNGWEFRIAQGDDAPYTPGYSDVAHFAVNTVRGESRDTQEANARLIAAAPDLLAALEAIWPFVEEDDGGFATPQYQAAIDQVRAAIAKARGE